MECESGSVARDRLRHDCCERLPCGHPKSLELPDRFRSPLDGSEGPPRCGYCEMVADHGKCAAREAKWIGSNEQLRAEVARLRGNLEFILQQTTSRGREFMGAQLPFVIRGVALEALGLPKEEA